MLLNVGAFSRGTSGQTINALMHLVIRKRLNVCGLAVSFLVSLSLAGCGKQEAPGPSGAPAVEPLAWPALARVHFLVKELIDHPSNKERATAWTYLVEETRLLEDMPVGVMNPLGVKSGVEQLLSLVAASPELPEEGLAAYRESLRVLVAASGLVLESEDGHVCATHGGGGARVEGPHHGLITPFHGEGLSGWAELKLHAGAGVIECWLARDRKLQNPYDLPLDTTLRLEYIVRGGSLLFKVRDVEQNLSLDGLPNIRDGATNYFLTQGAKEGNVVISFTLGGRGVRSGFFYLLPAHE